MDLKYRGGHPIYDFHNFYTNLGKKCENHLFFMKIAISTKNPKLEISRNSGYRYKKLTNEIFASAYHRFKIEFRKIQFLVENYNFIQNP